MLGVKLVKDAEKQSAELKNRVGGLEQDLEKHRVAAATTENGVSGCMKEFEDTCRKLGLLENDIQKHVSLFLKVDSKDFV